MITHVSAEICHTFARLQKWYTDKKKYIVVFSTQS